MVVSTTPCLANASPAVPGPEPLPPVKPPPCIQTITGNFDFFVAEAGAHTLRKRQSSDCIAVEPGQARCGQSAQNLFASRTPSHFFAGCVGRQRYSPTGGAAYGIPLKLETSPTVTPRKVPELVCTSGPEVESFCALRTNDKTNVNPKNNIFIVITFIRLLFVKRNFHMPGV